MQCRSPVGPVRTGAEERVGPRGLQRRVVRARINVEVLAMVKDNCEPPIGLSRRLGPRPPWRASDCCGALPGNARTATVAGCGLRAEDFH